MDTKLTILLKASVQVERMQNENDRMIKKVEANLAKIRAIKEKLKPTNL